MVANVQTVAFSGIDVLPIEVQVQITSGLPAFTIVGLPDKAVGESRERVRGALHAMGLSLPPKRITVNLAPADVTKEGSHYDLPIALGLLCAMGILPKEELAGACVLGELGLDSRIRAVGGVLPAAIHASASNLNLICPGACGAEAAWAGGLDVLAPDDLLQLINHFKGTQVLRAPVAALGGEAPGPGLCLSDIRGQESAKRALEIAAAGGHNILMAGPPGSGKSMLAQRLPGILPPLSPKEALEVSMIHSLAGLLPEGGMVRARPYRDPHHSASLPALVGGGARAKPGEISLAHRGVLFLDELPEFARASLEALRQPLETGQAVIARVNSHAVWPARFQLVAAMNPCRCGYLGDPAQECTRAPKCAAEYQGRLSGPLLDRIDMHIEVPAVSLADLNAPKTGEASAIVAARVAAARTAQAARHGEGVTNATLPVAQLEDACALAPDAKALVDQAAANLNLSARGYHRLLRVARTIADLDGAAALIGRVHLAEALSYRAHKYLNT
ncbi:MAG: YifB family Mg chelatase-like AAA ATPase [Rhodospirillales bacterium]|nr:YifB family Mg chelatase-like AAA ATPase [Alphaproteobacteria bacterium]MCB9986563.1 YifB family Mg chelatase-like AAA ATPase [Rhodospirillales bacterium]USO06904.1 MAG: YifB family Mg chelatase-like AAA ATPase [Rhodospirillales bacterium]